MTGTWKTGEKSAAICSVCFPRWVDTANGEVGDCSNTTNKIAERRRNTGRSPTILNAWKGIRNEKTFLQPVS